jgi:tRNA(Ile)-lysidine synthase
MLASFLTFINQLGVDLNSKPTLLTVSGGVDSVVMADLFHSAGLKAAIAHCNFGLRGEDSDGDELFVKDLASRYQFPFYVRHFETKSYAKQNGVSTQMAARDLRYNWFEEIRKEGFGYIATAHHANDALETVLLNLVRGTGIAGLCGIHPVKGNLLRPMLFADKDQIIAHAHERGLSWREDVSNDSVDYKRNLIRKAVVPVLKQLNPSLEHTFQVTAEKIRAADGLLTAHLTDWKTDFEEKESGELVIPKVKLTGIQDAAYLLGSVIEDLGFSYIQSRQIVSVMDGEPGAFFFSATHQLLIERDALIVRARSVTESKIRTYMNGVGEFVSDGARITVTEVNGEIELGKDRHIIYLKSEALKFPLIARNWEHGDVFCPFGMKGKRKKVSDVLIDAKYSRFEKEKVKVLTDAGGQILWLIGIRTDERQRIGEGVQQLFRVEWQENATDPN